VSTGRDFRFHHFLIAGLIVLADQVTKRIVEHKVPLNDGWIQVIPGFFQITHVQNRGAAFSIFSSGTSELRTVLLVVFSTVAAIAVAYFLLRLGRTFSVVSIALSLVLGGAVGNLWDRIVHGRVTDFLHFYVGQYSWPDFNVADSAIVVGAILLMIEIIWPRKQNAATRSGQQQS